MPSKLLTKSIDDIELYSILLNLSCLYNNNQAIKNSYF